MERCPVCNHEVKNKNCKGVGDGVVYYFCCKECEKVFESEPRKFINCCKEQSEDEE